MGKKSKRKPDGKARRRGYEPPRRRGVPWLPVALVGLAAWGGYVLWQGRAGAASFDRYLAQGQGLELAVQEEANLGSSHLQPGAKFRYAEPTPTSGPHSPFDLAPGFYAKPQPLERLVHNLEHGNVVVYYDAADPGTLRLLKAWARTFGGTMDGLVVAPMEGLGSKIVLTAWQKQLELEPFDPVAAAVFIDAYRGRGPEARVR